MKQSYVISAVTVALLCVAAFLFYGMADGPTKATSAAALAMQTLPVDLPRLYTPNHPDDDAGPYYEKAIDLYRENDQVLPRTPEHDALVDGLANLLLGAADAGHVEDGFLDTHVPVAIGALPDYGDAIEQINEAVINRSAYLFTHGDPAGARDLALAVWVMGRRMFEHNVRHYNRIVGLDLMESAGSMLYEMSASDDTLDTDVIMAWASAISDIRQAWQLKLEIVLGVAPHPGDLVNIALNDQDPTFRVEATLRLGIHRYSADRGNRRAMEQAISHAVDSSDPMMNRAGEAAQALTLEEKRRLF